MKLIHSKAHKRKVSKGRRLARVMAEAAVEGDVDSRQHTNLPFRMADMDMAFAIPQRYPLANEANTIAREWYFQLRLLKNDWSKQHVSAIIFGMLAFLLGSVSPELWGGGNAKIAGLDGILAINGFQFFQVLISILLWAWFVYQAWTLFPVMRVHAISLLVMWIGLMVSQIFFQRSNATFPFGLSLSDMMEGTLIILVVFFFLFFFWKAVIETRDLHVEVNHLHEDVRVMEAEMAEHSLKGWTAIFGVWIGLIMVTTWTGVRHISSYGDENYGFLVVHLLTGMVSIPLFFFILWYPQRMLGEQARVRTRAALDAAIEMEGEGITHEIKAKCPDCSEPSLLMREASGSLVHPCQNTGCSTMVTIGTACTKCSTTMPSRLECKACGVNAPALDYFPDQDVW